MKLSNWLLVGVVLGALAAAAPAQRMQLGDGSGREVVVLDVRKLLPESDQPGPKLLAVNADEASAESVFDGPEAMHPMLVLTSALVSLAPQATKLECSVQPLGSHHVVIMGPPEFTAAAAAFVRHTESCKEHQFQVELQFYEVSSGGYEAQFAPLLQGGAPLLQRGASSEAADGSQGPPMTVLDAQAMEGWSEKVEASGATVTSCPTVVLRSMCVAQLAMIKQTSYVRDFKVVRVGDKSTAKPVLDIVQTGIASNVSCVECADGRILVDARFSDRKMARPMSDVTTRIPGIDQEVKIQVPSVKGSKASLRMLLPSGSAAVVAARHGDGKWLLVMAKVQRVDQEAKPR